LGAFAGLGEGVRVRWRLATDPLALGSTPGQGWWIDDVQFANTLVPSVCNRAPVANDDTAGTTQNTPVTISVLANDTDPDGDPLTVQSVTQPANGTATTNGTTATYTPNNNFTGTDTFTYTVRDTAGNTATAKVTVTVSATPNRPPVAANDTASTPQNTPVTINVVANDTDPDGDALTVTGVTQGAHGSVINNGNGTVKYSPNAGYVGPDTFTYTISDGHGGTATGQVTVTVQAPT